MGSARSAEPTCDRVARADLDGDPSLKGLDTPETVQRASGASRPRRTAAEPDASEIAQRLKTLALLVTERPNWNPSVRIEHAGDPGIECRAEPLEHLSRLGSLGSILRFAYIALLMIAVSAFHTRRYRSGGGTLQDPLPLVNNYWLSITLLLVFLAGGVTVFREQPVPAMEGTAPLSNNPGQ